MMMRSSRVREETPQPTMRVTDGSSALSMICREETRTYMPLRKRCTLLTNAHTHTHTNTHTKRQRETRAGTHTNKASECMCYLE